MTCPECRARLYVRNTRSLHATTARRYACPDCGAVVYSLEHVTVVAVGREFLRAAEKAAAIRRETPNV